MNTDKKEREALRLQLLANGYTPLRNVCKLPHNFNDWPTAVIDEDEVKRWTRLHAKSTGLRLDNGLCVVDFDIDDRDAMDAIADAVHTAHPELEQALVRFGGGYKEAWFLRCDEAFKRLHTRGFMKPGTAADDGVYRLEIFGGGDARQFGSFGPHSLDKRTGEVLTEYRWADDVSPATVPLNELMEVDKKTLFSVLDTTERVLLDLGWTVQEKSSKGENVARKVYDLTDGMLFDCNDDVTRTLDELRAAAGGEADLRCSASWLKDAPGSNRTRCIVGLARTGNLAVWDTQETVSHREAVDEPFEVDAQEVHAALEKIKTVSTTRQRDVRRPLLLPPPHAPLDVATAYAGTDCIIDGALTLRYWRDGWWRWGGTAWREIDRDVVSDTLYAFTAKALYRSDKNKEVPWSPTRKRIADVLDALRGVCRLPDTVEASTWSDGRKTGRIVAFTNGLLDLTTRELILHTPHYFNLNSLPFAYNPEANSPKFDRLLHSIWPDSSDDQQTLLQMLGYLVSGQTELHCLFGLIGPPRAGKGVISRLCEQLLGKENSTSLSLSDLARNFGLEKTIGKSLAIMPDVRTGGKDQQVGNERILSFTGEDTMAIDRKHRQEWVGRPTVRLMYVSNEHPQFGDASTALAGRFVMLPFERSFAGKEDRMLDSKLAEELPGIFNRAMEGLDSLQRAGHFTQSETARLMRQEVAEISSPLLVFISEECELGPGYHVGKNDLFLRYNYWAGGHGYPRLSQVLFGKNLKAAPVDISEKRPGGDDRERLLIGIRPRGNPASRGTAALTHRADIRIVEGGRASE